MFDDLKIRNKLVLLVAGPIVIIVLLAAFGAKSRQDTASESRQVERLTALARADSDVVDALQGESLYSTAFVGSGRETWKTEMVDARAVTDKAIEGALEQQRSLEGTSAAFRSASTLAADAADKLIYIRSAVDQGYRWDQVVTTYQALQSTFLEVNDAIANNIDDPQVASDLRTGASLAAYKANLAQQGALLVGASERGIDVRDIEDVPDDEVGDKVAVSELQGRLKDSMDQEASSYAVLTSIADTGRKGEIRDALTSDDLNVLVTQIRDEAFNPEGLEGYAPDPEQATKATLGILGDLHEVESNLYGEVIARSNDIRSTAERAANLFVLAAVLAILGAIAAAALLGRRITRPLNHLTAAADRLSSEQMPRLVEWLRNPSEDEMAFELGSLQPIEVESNDEIGRLANSFNDVQRVAGEVAAEQAALLRKGIGEMFVNLARRNQALLDRQIDFIDELERGEEDPDQLENLYRLDHLATRMRRNAESLLVLAGAEPPRRRGRPAPLANVVRAALAEVEDFARIDLLSFDEILVASNVAADLAHLLSELMENATNFSPPETRVEVVGHRTKADGYVISVTDHGIGMSNDQIAEANESLAKPPLVGLALSRSLGFIVVGRLAGRHGVTVRMMASPSGGVTAVVSIPPTLITDTPGLGTPPPEPAVAEPAEAPARLKPVLDASNAGDGNGQGAGAPLAFSPGQSLGADQPFGDGADGAAADPSQADAPAPVATGPVARTGASAPVDASSGLPNRRAQASGPELPPRRAPQPAPVPDEPAPAADLPEALPFVAPAADGAGESAEDERDETKPRLDGPPPAAPDLPARSGPRPTPTPARADADSKPFFLEESQPPRLFGRTAEADAPAPAPTPAPAAPAPAPPKPATPPAAPAASAQAAPTPATNGSAGNGSTDGGSAGKGSASNGPAPTSVFANGSGAESGTDSGPVPVTSSGLARRTPRQSGASRAIPGADVERGVGATRRSPEEVRNLLSGFRAGQQRARTEEPVPAGPPDEKDAHE